jgi:DNA polymerase I-like protein with 3'-5' exonuclease and polymerase domains
VDAFYLGNRESLCVHDEILLETPIESPDEVAPILKRIMEEARRSFLKIVPVEAEVVLWTVGLMIDTGS